MIVDMERWNPIVAKLYLRERKFNIPLVFVSQSYFKVPKIIRLIVTYHFMMKIPKKRELQKLTSNHSSNIDFKYFMKIYINFTKEPFSSLLNNAAFPSDNSLRFKKDLL